MTHPILVCDQKHLVDYGDLIYLTNCAGDENTVNSKLGRNIAGSDAWAQITRFWSEDYGCHCYGAVFFGKPGILLCEEMYPETCADLLPDGEQVMANLPKWMEQQCEALAPHSELNGCTVFVLCDTDAACNGDTCHELCCFIPVDLASEISEAIRFFCNQVQSNRHK